MAPISDLNDSIFSKFSENQQDISLVTDGGGFGGFIDLGGPKTDNEESKMDETFYSRQEEKVQDDEISSDAIPDVSRDDMRMTISTINNYSMGDWIGDYLDKNQDLRIIDSNNFCNVKNRVEHTNNVEFQKCLARDIDIEDHAYKYGCCLEFEVNKKRLVDIVYC